MVARKREINIEDIRRWSSGVEKSEKFKSLQKLLVSAQLERSLS
jgi:hypothetical protein